MEDIWILADVGPTWKSAIIVVSNQIFICKITIKYKEGQNFPKVIYKKLQTNIEDNPNLQPDEVGHVSRAAKSFCT